jgi:hypothetical protein
MTRGVRYEVDWSALSLESGSSERLRTRGIKRYESVDWNSKGGTVWRVKYYKWYTQFWTFGAWAGTMNERGWLW